MYQYFPNQPIHQSLHHKVHNYALHDAHVLTFLCSKTKNTEARWGDQQSVSPFYNNERHYDIYGNFIGRGACFF